MTNDMIGTFETFTINGKKASIDDFGLVMNVYLDSKYSTERFVPIAVAPKNVLNKYGITEAEFRGIQRKLEFKLGRISGCVDISNAVHEAMESGRECLSEQEDNVILTIGSLRYILNHTDLPDDTPIALARTNPDDPDEVYGFRLCTAVGELNCEAEEHPDVILIATSDSGKDTYGLISGDKYHGDTFVKCTKVWF